MGGVGGMDGRACEKLVAGWEKRCHVHYPIWTQAFLAGEAAKPGQNKLFNVLCFSFLKNQH